jgi:hypothetical protein
MISYATQKEKETILHYAKLLGDSLVEEIVARDSLQNKEEAIHFAKFFWNMVDQSNIEDEEGGDSSEHILEKIIITLMAYFRSSGYECEWDTVTDER